MGRVFTAADDDGSPRVVVVNERLAHRLFPKSGAVGRHVRMESNNADFKSSELSKTRNSAICGRNRSG